MAVVIAASLALALSAVPSFAGQAKPAQAKPAPQRKSREEMDLAKAYALRAQRDEANAGDECIDPFELF